MPPLSHPLPPPALSGCLPQSWLQPAIDALASRLQLLHNTSGRPAVYTTLQCYLIGAEEKLAATLARGAAHGVYPAVKLVRGAYMSAEQAHAKEMGFPSPLQASVQETAAAFDRCAAAAIKHHAPLVLATHNEQAVAGARAAIAAQGRGGEAASSCVFAQLFGMADSITYGLANDGYLTFKYLPFGPLETAVPYLLRRVEENAAALGSGARRELEQIAAEIRRRAMVRGGYP